MDPVYGPGPYKWSMGPVQKGGPWTPVHVLSSPIQQPFKEKDCIDCSATLPMNCVTIKV